MAFELAAPDPTTLPYLVTAVLALAALASAWVAASLPGRRPQVDLEQLHRQIDLLREQVRRAGAAGSELSPELALLLAELRQSLPTGDLRREG